MTWIGIQLLTRPAAGDECNLAFEQVVSKTTSPIRRDDCFATRLGHCDLLRYRFEQVEPGLSLINGARYVGLCFRFECLSWFTIFIFPRNGKHVDVSHLRGNVR